MSKITPKQYAEALMRALEDKKISHEHAAGNFLALIRKNGDWRKRKEILEACADLLRKSGGKNLVEILSARKLGNDQRARIEAMFRAADFEARVDPELIAGVKIVIDREKQFDGTLKRKLDAILGSA